MTCGGTTSTTAGASRSYDEENDQIVYTSMTCNHFDAIRWNLHNKVVQCHVCGHDPPSRDEEYRILKARSDELKSALTDLDPCRDCQRSTASCHVCEFGAP